MPGQVSLYQEMLAYNSVALLVGGKSKKDRGTLPVPGRALPHSFTLTEQLLPYT